VLAPRSYFAFASLRSIRTGWSAFVNKLPTVAHVIPA
jgi:hypothetical protein